MRRTAPTDWCPQMGDDRAFVFEAPARRSFTGARQTHAETATAVAARATVASAA